jgi:subtilisin family serine protease
MIKKIIISIIVILSSVNVYGASFKISKYYSNTTKKTYEVAEGEILVKFRAHMDGRKVSVFALSRKSNVLEKLDIPEVYRLKVPEGSSMEQMIEDYNSNPDVEYAEPNYIRHAFIIPDDARFNEQWGLENTGQDGGTVGKDIDAVDAWEKEQGEPEIIIAVLDTGVDLDHPDLKDNLFSTGHDYVNNDNIADDDNDLEHGHGTHVAGIAAGKGDNGIGIAGVCWKCLILPVKVLAANGWGTDSNIALGIGWAARSGAKVINMSFGSTGNGATLETAVNNAYLQGCVLVAAMGNNDLQETNYPAGYPEVIAVGAINNKGIRCTTADWDSPYGSTYGNNIDVVAPGDNILSCLNNGDYGYMRGTSMATPFVAGACALLWSWNTDLTNAEIRQIIGETAVDVTTGTASVGWDMYTGSGTVNVYAAIFSILEGMPKENTVKVGNNRFDPTSGGEAVVYCSVAVTANITVKVYNMLGEEVIALVNNVNYSPGKYSFNWAGVNNLSEPVASGIYFVKMNVGNEVSVARVLVVK